MQFQAFDSLEEMLDAIDKNRRAADKRVEPWQEAVKPGDFFIQLSQEGICIFGEVLESDDGFYKTEAGRNYRFCKCYSIFCVEGELGDVHVSQIGMLIPKEAFMQFMELGWSAEPDEAA